MITINAPQIGKEEIEAVTRVLKSGILTHGVGAGPMVTEFERAFAKYAKTKHAVAMSSGTGALHSALAAAGILSARQPTHCFIQMNSVATR